MKSLDQMLKEIKLRAKRATPGPWDSYFETGIRPMVVTFDEHEGGYRSLKESIASMGRIGTHKDAEFIAHSREDVPRLVAALEAVLEGWSLLDEATKKRISEALSLKKP